MRTVQIVFRKSRIPLLLAAFLILLPGQARSDPHAHVSVSFGIGGFFGMPAYVGFGGYYYPGWYPPGPYPVAPGRPYYAFVDTDIHPETAEVYLDGRPIGTADDFDGYPGYLAIKPGHHALVFRHKGRRSLTFDLNLHAGEMFHLDQKMEKLPAGAAEEPPPPLPPKGGGEEPAPSRSAESHPGARTGHGTLRLEIQPAEARVSLDGDFFGTAAEIARVQGGIPLAPGFHRIQVSLSGYKSESMETEILEAAEQTIRISLRRQE